MRPTLCLAALPLVALLVGVPARAQAPAPAEPAATGDPLADTIARGLTRGLRLNCLNIDVTAANRGGCGAVRPATGTAPNEQAISLMINFQTGSAELTPEAEAVVASLARALETDTLRSARFRIEGHTDTVGSSALNQVLSEQRAATVRDALIYRYRIAPDRLQTRGFGEAMLLVPTADGVAEGRNRRVQVVNLGD